MGSNKTLLGILALLATLLTTVAASPAVQQVVGSFAASHPIIGLIMADVAIVAALFHKAPGQ